VTVRLRPLAALLFLAWSCASPPPLAQQKPSAKSAPEVAAKQRGLSYAAANPRRGTYGSEQSAESLKNAHALGVDWISVMPFGFQRAAEPGIRLGGWETDESVVATIEQAHALGMKVLLKPHLWSRETMDREHWSDEDRLQFFEEYEHFAVHFAEVARDGKADAYCIGNELKYTSRHEAEWRRIIARVRSIYSGPLTYGANFDEVFDVPFWDALDWIGVSAYFPLVDAPTPKREELIAAWQPIASSLEQLSARHAKPVLFTEIGYRSCDGAAWRQWEIPRDAPVNHEAQRVAYEAFFETMWPRPWLLGAYPWKWFSYPEHSHATSNDFEFEQKPAQAVIEQAYRQAREAQTSAATSSSKSSMRR
jgi:hypothetical protein